MTRGVHLCLLFTTTAVIAFLRLGKVKEGRRTEDARKPQEWEGEFGRKGAPSVGQGGPRADVCERESVNGYCALALEGLFGRFSKVCFDA